jgi:glutamate synthase domain-containing protein 3
MAKNDVTEKKPIEAARTAIGSRFTRYKKEDEKTVQQFDVRERLALRQMIEAWKLFRIGNQDYNKAWAAIKRIKYSKKDVEDFCIALAELQGSELSGNEGPFLSALINKKRGREYNLHVAHLPGRINDLGSRNIGKVTIVGDIGLFAGREMKRGWIRINGNAHNGVGFYMRGGEITVDGDAGTVGGNMKKGFITVTGDVLNDAGSRMNGGRIIIHGNVKIVGGNIGRDSAMRGGEIHVYGEIGEIGEIQGGKVYQQDRLIIDR